MKCFSVMPSALIILLMSGCATIISGSSQTISVDSNPGGATVTAEPGEHKTTTPGKLVLKRKEGPYRLTFSLEGYEPHSVMLSTGSNGWIWGNLLLGGLIGIIVDSSTGAVTKLSPDEVHANLVKLGIKPQTSSAEVLYVFNRNGALVVSIEAQ